jgi:TPR repeat protein
MAQTLGTEPNTQVVQTNNEQELGNQDHFGQLSDKQLISKEGHIVTFREEDKLQAIVKEEHETLSRTHILPIYIEQETSLKDLLNKQEKMHVVLPKGDKPGYVYIGSMGLKGGMEGGGSGDEKSQNQQKEKGKERASDKVEKGKEVEGVASEGEKLNTEDKEEGLLELASGGNKDAQYALGQVAYKKWQKLGRDEDYQVALDHLSAAVEQKHKPAIALLQKLRVEKEIEIEGMLEGVSRTGISKGKLDKEKISLVAPSEIPQSIEESKLPSELLYTTGQGVRENLFEAHKWYHQASQKGHKKAKHQLEKQYKKNKKAAKKGNVEAQFNLGLMYYNGLGVDKDYAKAVEWYQKAADQGLAVAQFNLGTMYENGRGVAKDYTKAFEWYEKAADQGYAKAQFNLGWMYQNGLGVDKDYAKAFEWYGKAADQGYANAQYSLGVMYQNGLGVEKNYTRAAEWFKRSANQGYPEAQFNLGVMYENGEGVTKDDDKAVEWYEKAADQGYANAQYSLGVMYREGCGVRQDYAKAKEWYEKAAKKGNVEAQFDLGLMYYFGQGVAQDYAKAFEWIQKAADQGNAGAQNNLGFMYEKGEGVEKNYLKAFEWYEKAAKQGLAQAQLNLGLMYYNGLGVDKDYAKAFEWYGKAAKKGNVKAQFDLGLMYYFGQGVAQDYAKAFEWIQKAADQEYVEAKIWLEKMRQDGQGEEEEEINRSSLKDDNKLLEEAINVLKRKFDKAESSETPEAWKAEIPVEDQAIQSLPPQEQQALEQVGKILFEYNAKYCQALENLSGFCKAKQKFSNAFSKAAKVAKRAISGPDINSLKKLQKEVEAEYGEEVLKLHQARMEKIYKESLTNLTTSYVLEREELKANLRILQNQTNSALKVAPNHEIEVMNQEKMLLDQLIGERERYEATCKRLENPVQSALEDFYDWKRSIFNDFLKTHLGNCFITYEALAIGEVARHHDPYEKVLEGATLIGSVVADAFLPLGGLAVDLAGGVVQKGVSLYKDKKMRIKAAKIGRLYEHHGLEKMVKVTQEVADGLLYRLKDAILDLTPESLDKLAKVATTQMIDYALKKWDEKDTYKITTVELLLRGTQHTPSWFGKFMQTLKLKTEDGGSIDVWTLLNQGQEEVLDESKFMESARFFAKQVQKYGGTFIEYAGHVGEAAYFFVSLIK